MTITIVYHKGCYDGIWAAACVLAAESINHGAPTADIPVTIVPMQYGDRITDDVMRTLTADVLYIVDFSVSYEDLIRLSAVCGRIIWIDHHPVIDKYKSLVLPSNVKPILDLSRSGALIAYEEVLHPLRANDPDAALVLPILYVNDRDLWKWEIVNSKAINCGLSTWLADIRGNGSEQDQVKMLADLILTTSDWGPYVDAWRNDGSAQLLMQQQLASRVNVTSIPTKTLASVVDEPWTDVAYRLMPYGSVQFVNSSMLHSEIGDSLADSGNVVCVYTVRLNDGNVTMSWRSKNGSAGPIAEEMGGGGHANAAGSAMSIDKFFSIPWSLMITKKEA